MYNTTREYSFPKLYRNSRSRQNWYTQHKLCGRLCLVPAYNAEIKKKYLKRLRLEGSARTFYNQKGSTAVWGSRATASEQHICTRTVTELYATILCEPRPCESRISIIRVSTLASLCHPRCSVLCIQDFSSCGSTHSKDRRLPYQDIIFYSCWAVSSIRNQN
jgi:hypothetical protein